MHDIQGKEQMPMLTLTWQNASVSIYKRTEPLPELGI